MSTLQQVLVIFGTRPEAVKMAPVVRALARRPDRFFVCTCATAQYEEAPSLGKPVLVLRETAERPEAAVCGASRVVRTDPERIVSEACHLLEDRSAYERIASVQNPYGDGHAAERIAEALSVASWPNRNFLATLPTTSSCSTRRHLARQLAS